MDDPAAKIRAERFTAIKAAKEAEAVSNKIIRHETVMVRTDAWKEMISQMEELKREIKRLKKTVS